MVDGMDDAFLAVALLVGRAAPVDPIGIRGRVRTAQYLERLTFELATAAGFMPLTVIQPTIAIAALKASTGHHF